MEFQAYYIDNERMRMCYNCLQKRLGELEKEQENSKEEVKNYEKKTEAHKSRYRKV